MFPFVDGRLQHAIKHFWRGMGSRAIRVFEGAISMDHVGFQHPSGGSCPLSQRDRDILCFNQFTSCLTQEVSQMAEDAHVKA